MGQKIYKEDAEERFIPVKMNNKLKNMASVRFLRSLLWLSLNLGKGDVKSWLEEFDPEIIFFCGGNANYLYNKVLKLSKKYNAKIIYYITDDYILPYFSFNVFDKINRVWTRKVFKNMCRNSSLVFTIGDKMSKVYKERYGVQSNKIMNLVEINDEKPFNNDLKDNDLQFLYVGGLHSNRWKVLSLIGKSLERISQKGLRGNLKIFSMEQPEDKILEELNNKEYSMYCGALDAKGIKKAINEADILVHVESFDRKSKRVTYLSVSTKIPEYMCAGKCILAVGPSDVASMEYIKDTNTGFVIMSTNKEDIDSGMINIFENIDKRRSFVEQSFLVARKNHDVKTKRNEFQQKIINLGNKIKFPI